MLKEGLEKQEILKILEKKLEKDFSYNSGSILGSMCTEPLDFGVEIYTKYLSKNLGDPGLFLGTTALEEELVSEIGELFNGKNIIGSFTTGGSEANLIAMRIAKILKKEGSFMIFQTSFGISKFPKDSILKIEKKEYNPNSESSLETPASDNRNKKSISESTINTNGSGYYD